jgi:hypothetical protein
MPALGQPPPLTVPLVPLATPTPLVPLLVPAPPLLVPALPLLMPLPLPVPPSPPLLVPVPLPRLVLPVPALLGRIVVPPVSVAPVLRTGVTTLTGSLVPLLDAGLVERDGAGARLGAGAAATVIGGVDAGECGLGRVWVREACFVPG